MNAEQTKQKLERLVEKLNRTHEHWVALRDEKKHELEKQGDTIRQERRLMLAWQVKLMNRIIHDLNFLVAKNRNVLTERGGLAPWSVDRPKGVDDVGKKHDPCAWHGKQEALAEGETPGCTYCGTMYDTRTCEGCGKDFLNWESQIVDDACAAPRVTSSGDMACARCVGSIDRQIEESEEAY